MSYKKLIYKIFRTEDVKDCISEEIFIGIFPDLISVEGSSWTSRRLCDLFIDTFGLLGREKLSAKKLEEKYGTSKSSLNTHVRKTILKLRDPKVVYKITSDDRFTRMWYDDYSHSMQMAILSAGFDRPSKEEVLEALERGLIDTVSLDLEELESLKSEVEFYSGHWLIDVGHGVEDILEDLHLRKDKVSVRHAIISGALRYGVKSASGKKLLKEACKRLSDSLASNFDDYLMLLNELYRNSSSTVLANEPVYKAFFAVKDERERIQQLDCSIDLKEQLFSQYAMGVLSMMSHDPIERDKLVTFIRDSRQQLQGGADKNIRLRVAV